MGLRNGTAHSRLGPHTSIDNEYMGLQPQTCLQANRVWEIPQPRRMYEMIIGSVKLMVKAV